MWFVVRKNLSFLEGFLCVGCKPDRAKVGGWHSYGDWVELAEQDWPFPGQKPEDEARKVYLKGDNNG